MHEYIEYHNQYLMKALYHADLIVLESCSSFVQYKYRIKAWLKNPRMISIQLRSKEIKVLSE